MTNQESVSEEFRVVARDAVRAAQAAGAQGVSARIARVRDVAVQWRDGQIEQVTDGFATTASTQSPLRRPLRTPPHASWIRDDCVNNGRE